MNFGAHIFLWVDCWTNSCLYLYDNARQLGLEVLEIAVGDDVQFNEAAVRAEASKTGLKTVTSPGGEWPMRADISLPEAADRAFAIDWHKKWIARSGEAGSIAYTGALYGHPGRIIKAAPDADEFKRVTEGLHQLSEYAQKAGVRLVLEPMSHFRTHVANTADQIMQLVKAADHPNLKVLLDTYHLITEERDFAQAATKMAPALWGLHACENDRGCPGGGLVPWTPLFEALHAVKFDGYYIFESYNSSIGSFAFSRGMFHHVCADGNLFVQTGMKFLQGVHQNTAR